MPNLLAHFGIQGVLGRALVPRADLRWILLGALLPDIAWILHRLLHSLTSIDPYALRAYAIAQASLAACLVLAAGLCLLARARWRAFAILASGSLLHLILDASQTKWGNGVNLAAPFSWRIWNAGCYWPEGLPTVALTLFGGAWVAWAWRKRPGELLTLQRPAPARGAAAAALLLAYAVLPWMWIGAVSRADTHSIATLRDHAARAGREVAFDRARYHADAAGGTLEIWTRERLRVANGGPERSGIVSVRGHFVGADTLAIEALHVHLGRARDVPSYLGLVVLLALWVVPRGRGERAPLTSAP